MQITAKQPPKRPLGQQNIHSPIRPAQLAVKIDKEVSTSRDVTIKWNLVGRLSINANRGGPDEFEIVVKNLTKLSETQFDVRPTNTFKV